MTSSSLAVSKRKMVVQVAGTYQAWLRIKAAQDRTWQGRRETMRQADEDHSGQGTGTLSGGRGGRWGERHGGCEAGGDPDRDKPWSVLPRRPSFPLSMVKEKGSVCF